MIKSIFTLVLAIFALNLSFGINSDLFSYDSGALNNKLREIEQLEMYVANNPNLTLADLEAQNNMLVNKLNLSGSSAGMMASIYGEPALGVPGFWLGCILGPVGVLVVHLAAEDKAETKSAIWGCAVTSVVAPIAYYALIYGYIYAVFSSY